MIANWTWLAEIGYCLMKLLADFVLWHLRIRLQPRRMLSVVALVKSKELEVASEKSHFYLTDHLGQPDFQICLASVQCRLGLCTVELRKSMVLA